VKLFKEISAIVLGIAVWYLDAYLCQGPDKWWSVLTWLLLGAVGMVLFLGGIAHFLYRMDKL
jgi:hypothetical protein